MVTVLVATDADAVAAEVDAALAADDCTVVRVNEGAAVADAVDVHRPDLVVLDLQIGNMGGMACCMHLRLEAGAGRLPETAVLMLLDRSPDSFLARRAGADGWLVKPLDSFRIGRAASTILGGMTYEENPDVETVSAVPTEPEPAEAGS